MTDARTTRDAEVVLHREAAATIAARTTRDGEVVLHRETAATINGRTTRNALIVFVKREMPGTDVVRSDRQADTIV